MPDSQRCNSSLLSFNFIRPLWLLALSDVLLVMGSLERRKTKPTWKIPSRIYADAWLSAKQGWRKRSCHWSRLRWFRNDRHHYLFSPTWQREVSPLWWRQSVDVSRLITKRTVLGERLTTESLGTIRQKVRDLLAARKGGKYASVVYASSAHVAMPVTPRQGKVFDPFCISHPTSCLYQVSQQK